MAKLTIGNQVKYNDMVYTIVSIDKNGLLTAEAPKNEWGGIPTLVGESKLFEIIDYLNFKNEILKDSGKKISIKSNGGNTFALYLNGMLIYWDIPQDKLILNIQKVFEAHCPDNKKNILKSMTSILRQLVEENGGSYEFRESESLVGRYGDKAATKHLFVENGKLYAHVYSGWCMENERACLSYESGYLSEDCLRGLIRLVEMDWH